MTSWKSHKTGGNGERLEFHHGYVSYERDEAATTWWAQWEWAFEQAQELIEGSSPEELRAAALLFGRRTTEAHRAALERLLNEDLPAGVWEPCGVVLGEVFPFGDATVTYEKTAPSASWSSHVSWRHEDSLIPLEDMSQEDLRAAALAHAREVLQSYYQELVNLLEKLR